MNRFSLALDSTQINSMMTCPQQWKFAYRDWLKHKTIKTTALDWGTIFHALADPYYLAIKSGERFDAAQKFALSKLDNATKEVRTLISFEDKKFITQRFIAYTMRWYNQDIMPIEIEKGFSIPILDNQYFFFVLEGRIDLIGFTKDGTRIWMDHKTQEQAKDLYSHSIQFLNYSYATGLSNGIINYVGWQKEINDKTFRRDLLYFSHEKIRQWHSRLLTYFFRATNLILMDKYEKNESSCAGKYNTPCEFHEICEELSPQIQQGLIQMNYEKREPWLPWIL